MYLNPKILDQLPNIYPYKGEYNNKYVTTEFDYYNTYKNIIKADKNLDKFNPIKYINNYAIKDIIDLEQNNYFKKVYYLSCDEIQIHINDNVNLIDTNLNQFSNDIKLLNMRIDTIKNNLNNYPPLVN